MDQPTVVAVVTDLLFQSRLREVVVRMGRRLVVADEPAALRTALADRPALVVVDLDISGLDWREAVTLARQSAVPVLAFGRHTEAQLLRSAREAGCDRVVPRSTFVEELPKFIQRLAGATT
jgi:CheY-like chemotaxis protein